MHLHRRAFVTGGAALAALTLRPNPVSAETAGKLPELDLRNAGLRGDGSDETEAFARMAAAGAGKRVILPKGTFTLDALALLAGCVLEAQGPGQTTLRRRSGSTSKAFLSQVVADGIVTRGLTIDGNSEGQRGDKAVKAYGMIRFRTKGAVCEDVQIVNCFGIGLGDEENQGSVNRRVEVSHSGAGAPGFHAGNEGKQAGAGGHLYEDCRSLSNDLDGIILSVDNCTIRGGAYNRNGLNAAAKDLGAAGIYGDPKLLRTIVVAGAEVAFNTAFGLEIAADGLTIRNVRAHDNGLSGLFLRKDTRDATVQRCVSSNNGTSRTRANPEQWLKAGLQFDRVTDVRIEENRFFDDRGSDATQDYGIAAQTVGASRDVKIAGNTMAGHRIAPDNIAKARKLLPGLRFNEPG